MLGGQGYDDNDNDNDDDLGYTGNDNQGSPYTPSNRGGYNGYPQAGQSQTSFFGPKNTYESRSFSVIKTYTQTVTGNGPWQIGIYATDTGWFAGMFATVWVDDKVFSTTSQANNKFRMSKDQQGPGWDTDPYFFEGKWKAQTEDLCAKRNYKWSSFMPEMNRMTAPHTARAMWFPNCDSSASESSPSIMYFRLTANAYTP
ncbi:hypothetical protein BSLG_010033 [Batrachochytrium salamandrivorans]|nr:hypothetical protein BSLG_010033 [Batrachochytrium salamandrivorans]